MMLMIERQLVLLLAGNMTVLRVPQAVTMRLRCEACMLQPVQADTAAPTPGTLGPRPPGK